MELGVHWRSLARCTVDMKIDLLGRSDDHIIAGPPQLVKQMHPLVIHIEQLCRYIQALEGLGLSEIAQVGLDRVHGATAPAIRIVDADLPEEHVGCIPEYLQIA